MNLHQLPEAWGEQAGRGGRVNEEGTFLRFPDNGSLKQRRNKSALQLPDCHFWKHFSHFLTVFMQTICLHCVFRKENTCLVNTVDGFSLMCVIAGKLGLRDRLSCVLCSSVGTCIFKKHICVVVADVSLMKCFLLLAANRDIWQQISEALYCTTVKHSKVK